MGQPVALEGSALSSVDRLSCHAAVSRAMLLLAAMTSLSASPLYAQDAPECFFFCQPELKIEPTFTVENVFKRHRTLDALAGPATTPIRAEREVVFEAIVALDIPTSIPRIGFTFETIFVPFASTDENPFTGVTAPQIQRASIRDNSPEVELEFNIEWLSNEDTGGWIGSHVDIVDKISPAERPADASAYTHKLNFELDTAVHAFNWLPDGNWLRGVEVEGSLDYVATGLPRAGDILGSEIYLDDASPWSFSLVFVVPLIPLR